MENLRFEIFELQAITVTLVTQHLAGASMEQPLAGAEVVR